VLVLHLSQPVVDRGEMPQLRDVCLERGVDLCRQAARSDE